MSVNEEHVFQSVQAPPSHWYQWQFGVWEHASRQPALSSTPAWISLSENASEALRLQQ
jgi:hypothetical protein